MILSNASFANEIMKCFLKDGSKTYIYFYKLERNYFSDDKIYRKKEGEWIHICPCNKVKNKSVTCNQQWQTQCKNEFGDFVIKDKINMTVDFETYSLNYTGYGNHDCKLIE